LAASRRMEVAQSPGLMVRDAPEDGRFLTMRGRGRWGRFTGWPICHPSVICYTHDSIMRFLATFHTFDFLDTLLSLATAFVLGTLIGAER
jgi:hypothetical protein